MKRLFTFAVITMMASMSFAQPQMATKKSQTKIQRVVDVATLNKATEAKSLQAVRTQKSNAEQIAATSLFRNVVKTNPALMLSINNTPKLDYVLPEKKLAQGGVRFNSAPRATVTTEGNVTITTDENGIITDVTGVEPKVYRRTAGYAYYLSGQQIAIGYQSGNATIIEDGDNVYMLNPVSYYDADSWVVGVKDGNNIIVSANQPLAYSTDYETTLSLRWGVVDTSGSISVADDHADAFTFTVDGNVISLQGTMIYDDGTEDAYYMGVFWDDDDSASGYGDAETVLTYDENYVAPSTDLVVLPDGVETEAWYLNGYSLNDSGATPVKNQNVKVAFDGTDVYIQGLFAAFPDSYVKGVADGTSITFDKLQFLGNYNGQYNIWMIGAAMAGYDEEGYPIYELGDATATYDAEAKAIAFDTDLLANAATDRVYYLTWLDEVVVSADAKEYVEPTITELTASLPYNNALDTDAERADVAIYDANEDDCTFVFYETDDGNVSARYNYNSVNNADDYLVFPGLALTAGNEYIVTVDAWAASSYYPEALEIVAGTEAKASKLNITLLEKTVIDSSAEEPQSFEIYFTPEEDGVYYIAIHGISEANAFYMYVDNFSVRENNPLAPVAVDDLAVVADQTGANAATVTFTVPSTLVSGDAIEGNVDVKVTRNGEVIKEEALPAGSAVEFIDQVEAPGTYAYTVNVAKDGNVGSNATIKAYIGVDIPGAVENFTVADRSGSLELAWEEPTEGANGYLVLPEEFTYNVYPVVMEYFWGFYFPTTDYENPITTGLTETEYAFEYPTNEGEQDYIYFSVTTNNSAGEGDETFGAALIGAPYQLPVRENLTGGNVNYWWGVEVDEALLDGGSSGYLAEEGYDDDCSFELYGEDAGWVTLQSGKIDLADAANPVVSFVAKGDGTASLSVTIVTPNSEKTIKTITPEESFEATSISLLDFVGEDWIRIYFTGDFSQASNILVDNIRIYNQLDNNLSAEAISAPARVNANENFIVRVVVENQGVNAVAADGYTVNLYVNGAKAQTEAGVEIAPDQVALFDFVIETNPTTADELVVSGEIVYAADEDTANNATDDLTIKVKKSSYPVVTDLVATKAEAGVALTWGEPDTDTIIPEEVTEDFESYPVMAVENIGDWTLYDNDGCSFGFEGLPSTLSFFVFAGEEDMAGHSGNQYMSNYYNTDGSANSDWLISPLLSGDAQTISFWAKSCDSNYLETVAMYYSTTDKDVESFVKVNSVEVPGEWTEYAFDVPDGAKYFAIVCESFDKFRLFIDDVTYTIIPNAGADLTIVGYNIYRNGVKINEDPVAECAYTDAEGADNDAYVVTAVYAEGESAASNVASVNGTTGINNAVAGAASVKVVNRTIVVNGAVGNVAVYTVDGKTIYSQAAAANNAVAVTPGVYVVKYGKSVCKVLVK